MFHIKLSVGHIEIVTDQYSKLFLENIEVFKKGNSKIKRNIDSIVGKTCIE